MNDEALRPFIVLDTPTKLNRFHHQWLNFVLSQSVNPRS